MAGSMTYQLDPRRFGTFGRSHQPETGGLKGDSIPKVKDLTTEDFQAFQDRAGNESG